jgi:hypothetical protein
MKFLMTIESAFSAGWPDDGDVWAPDDAGVLELLPQAVSSRTSISPGNHSHLPLLLSVI